MIKANWTRFFPSIFLVLMIASVFFLLHRFYLQEQKKISSLSWGAVRPALPSPPSVLAPPVDISALAATRDRPLFWESRRPPPPVQKSQPQLVQEPPKLIGISIGIDGQGVAILAPGGSVKGSPVRVRLGTSAFGYSVERITQNEVVLGATSGAVTLSLPRKLP